MMFFAVLWAGLCAFSVGMYLYSGNAVTGGWAAFCALISIVYAVRSA